MITAHRAAICKFCSAIMKRQGTTCVSEGRKQLPFGNVCTENKNCFNRILKWRDVCCEVQNLFEKQNLQLWK